MSTMSPGYNGEMKVDKKLAFSLFLHKQHFLFEYQEHRMNHFSRKLSLLSYSDKNV